MSDFGLRMGSGVGRGAWGMIGGFGASGAGASRVGGL